MSRARGLALQNALARYLAAWWPSAESAGAGRPGTDILGTPGVVWENKTAREFRPAAWVRQAKAHAICRCTQVCAPGCDGDTGDLPVAVYWPDGVGAGTPAAAMAIVPLPDLMKVLVAAGYAPQAGCMITVTELED